jgi:hypothetical protein
MEPAIHDLVRELGSGQTTALPAAEPEVEILDDDDLLLDPWFFRTEEEIAALADDPEAHVIEIRIEGYGTGFADKRWAF